MQIINSKLQKKKTIAILLFSLTLVCKASVLNSARLISLPIRQAAIASADLNNDGKPDLIVGGDPLPSESGKIRVLLGNGNGTFQPETTYRVGYNLNVAFDAPFVEKIQVGDLNNDGNLDVVVAHNGERSISTRSVLFITVLFGDGTGNLQTDDSYYFIDQYQIGVLVSSIDFGDFNNDGKTDIVLGCPVESNTGEIFFLENLGNNRFRANGPKTIGTNIYEIAVADFNNDSHADLIMTTYEGVIIFYGNGNFFYPLTEYEQRDADIFVRGLVVKDFNNDGKTDFAVMDYSNPVIHVFLNGTRGISSNPVVYQTDVSFGLLKSSDINNDGKLDLSVTDGLTGNLQILYGDGTGSFTISPIKKINLPISDYTFADFDRNGKTDMAFSLFQDPPASQAGIFLTVTNLQTSSAYDFDGDGKADVSVFRPGSGTWYLLGSQNGFSAAQFGNTGDKIVPADFDGDGRTDLAVFRGGIWYLQRSTAGFSGIQFGEAGDIPQPADFDGDGKADLGVFRPSTASWYVLNLVTNQPSAFQFGESSDKPVVGDYDGDGQADYAVFRPTTNIWYLRRSTAGFTGVQFGEANDKLVPADYDGDGKTDLAVFRPSTATWYLQRSQGGFTGIQFGISTDLPVPADYDGDGRTDIAVFRNGTWYLQRSQAGFTGVQFGEASDLPAPNAFVQ